MIAASSQFKSTITNNGYPTNIINYSSRFIGGTDALNDTIVSHDTTALCSILESGIFNQGIFDNTTNLEGEGLTEKVLVIFFTRLRIFFDKLVLIFFVTRLFIKNKPFFELLVT